MQDPEPNRIGTANLMVIAQPVMERMDGDGLVIEGGLRTTGALETVRNWEIGRREPDTTARSEPGLVIAYSYVWRHKYNRGLRLRGRAARATPPPVPHFSLTMTVIGIDGPGVSVLYASLRLTQTESRPRTALHTVSVPSIPAT